MNIYISYFNNVRNFNKYLIPVSTAMYDTKWFHTKEKKNFIDKNDVINGIKCRPLIFHQKLWTELMSTNEECCKDCSFYKDVEKTGHYCSFMKKYYNQLSLLDIDTIISWFKLIVETVSKLWHEDKSKFSIVLLVHEKYDKVCAERPVLVKWFKQHNINVEEWRKDI